MSEKNFINPMSGRMTALRGARNPHVPGYVPVSCAPGALPCIPGTEFLKLFLGVSYE